MAVDITATVDGTLLNWLKDVGDSVSDGEVIAEMDADKATLEIEAPAAGVLLARSAEVGDSIREGDVLGQLGAAEEAGAGNGASGSAEEAPAAANGAAVETPAEAGEALPEGRARISPIARRLARERGIDLARVKGSGPGGRVVRADIENYREEKPAPTASAPAATPSPAAPQRTPPPPDEDVEHVRPDSMRRRIAATTIESQQTIPHFYVTMDIDAGPLQDFRRQVNEALEAGGARVTVNDLVVRATAMTLRDFPNLNSHWYGDRIVRYRRINVGVAVALPAGGLMYVVAQDADRVPLDELAANNRAMALRAREGRVKLSDLTGATFSTSNLGAWGVSHFAAVINPPEAGVLAFGAAQKVPVVGEDGRLTAGERMSATISIDHRVSDGAEGAAFMQRFRELLEKPLALLGWPGSS
ncbi:MAG: dihydrolipoamide acetyltransferase family protein [Anaerolineaceae bacterium]|nr:dihydrolipoamide acetyltransferase family protein [Anaerolineaceae bacterium]MDE0328869.1 dihydrolipoamide acetyltransferase family protein [Anaerolineaceae bacterium]